MSDTVERKIYFFKLMTRVQGTEQPAPFVVMRDALQKISTMPHSYDGRRLFWQSGTQLTLTPWTSEAGHIGGKLAVLRTSGLPTIEKEGEERPIGLEHNESLFEPAHFVVFPPCVLAMEYNHYGPRATWLEKYIPAVVEEVTDLAVGFLVRDEAQRIVEHLGEVYSISLVAKAEMIGNIRSLDDSLHDGFASAADAAPGSKYIHFSFKRDGRDGTSRLNPGWLSRAGEWLTDFENRITFNKFDVVGKLDGEKKTRPFNLLEDRLVREVKVVKQDPTSRSIHSPTMYREIVGAYEAVRDELASVV